MLEYKLHTTETAPEGSKEILKGAKARLGFIPNLYAIMAESPLILKTYNEISDKFDSSSFTATEKQVVLLSTSFENECNYCMAVHSTIGKMQKIDENIIEALRNGKPISNTKIEALRKFTQTVVNKRGWITEEDAQSFLNAGYSKSQLLEVIVGVVQKTLSNYVNHIVKTPLDAPFESNKWEKLKN